jgi:hypothetical protein
MFSSEFTFDEFDIDSLSFERTFSLDSFVERALFFDFSVERALFLDLASLTSSKEEQSFESLKDLIQRVNEHVYSRDYAIILARTKNKEKKSRKT